jgi:histidyl-tRNA synthetase
MRNLSQKDSESSRIKIKDMSNGNEDEIEFAAFASYIKERNI